jgi:hypothetical protein
MVNLETITSAFSTYLLKARLLVVKESNSYPGGHVTSFHYELLKLLSSFLNTGKPLVIFQRLRIKPRFEIQYIFSKRGKFNLPKYRL